MGYNVERTMYQGFADSVKERGNHDCIYFYGATLSWNEFGKMVDLCAAGMVKNGVKAGDRVVICGPNIPQIIGAVYAVNKIGAIGCMLHPLSVKTEIEHAVTLTGAKFAYCFDVSEKGFDGMDVTLIKCRTDQYFEKTLIGKIRSIGYHKKIQGKTADAHVKKKMDWAELLTEGEAYLGKNKVEAASDPHAVSSIMFTGGTTGLPKGVQLTNYAINNLSYELFAVINDNFDKDKDGMLTALPVFHGFGYALCMHVSMLAGIAQAIFPTFDARACSRAIAKHHLNFIFGVPDFFEKVYKAGYLNKIDMSHFKLIGSGGDVVPATLTAKMDELLQKNGAKTHFVTGYGLTECVTVCSFTDPSRPAKPGCIGQTCYNIEAITVKPGTTEEVRGEDGELCIYGPTLMEGYYNDPEETQKMLIEHEDGKVWLHTGDMCYIDEIKDIYYRQRLKRVFKISGYLVYPSFIEETMRNMKEVYDCCVVSVEKDGKTTLKLYVVKHKRFFSEGEEELTQKILKFADANLSKWSVPREVEYIDELPRTKIGKVDFKVLQAMNQ